MEERKSEHMEELNRQQSIRNGGEPSNPIKDNTYYREGLTKREMMAMHIVTAYIAKGEGYKLAVTNAVHCADELLDELRKNKAK